jgi:plasmid stabilization system protein ParE
VIALSPEAETHVDQLIAYYEAKGRIDAAVNLLRVLELASQRILQAPSNVLEAPRPYPELKKAGRRWFVEGHYWIAYSETTPPVISGVHYATSDIPARL